MPTTDLYQYAEWWERDDERFIEELAMIAHNIIPYSGLRMVTRNATNWQSRNSWYYYARRIHDDKMWKVEVHPTILNPDHEYDKPHYVFDVMMPEEFLDEKLFMRINIGDV